MPAPEQPKATTLLERGAPTLQAPESAESGLLDDPEPKPRTASSNTARLLAREAKLMASQGAGPSRTASQAVAKGSAAA